MGDSEALAYSAVVTLGHYRVNDQYKVLPSALTALRK